MSDIALLAHLAPVLGDAPSGPTVRRALDLAGMAAMLERIARARAKARAHVWDLIGKTPAGFPWLVIAGKSLTGWLVIDMDATLVTASSDKEGAAATWKKGYGLLTELGKLSSQFSGRAAGPWLASLLMPENERYMDVAGLVVPSAGGLRETGDPWEPFQLIDPAGGVVGPVAGYLKDLQACGRSDATLRSYAHDLLRWFRFCWAAGLQWNQVTRAEAADFCRWLRIAGKAAGPHWRARRKGDAGEVAAVPVAGGPRRGSPNAVTGKPAPGRTYAASTMAHCETVLRHFYDFHLESGSGPLVNPFPLDRGRAGRSGAHHNPMQPYPRSRSGLFRPKVTQRAPRSIPDGQFSEIFARLHSHRDRALVAFWVSTGARAAELLGATAGDADAGQQLITVIRKGTRAMQQLPASPDAFVWLRLYQEQMHGLVAAGPDQPLWWTLRRPFRQLTYHAALRMFTRAESALGADWTLHDLRHTAGHLMARDPEVPLADVQWVLGHARLSTTQLYLNTVPDDVIADVVAFHARRARQPDRPAGPARDSGYRPESLKNLFGEAP